MAPEDLSPRATPGERSDPIRFTIPDLIGFTAYAIAVGAGRPAFEFLLATVLGNDVVPTPEVEEPLFAAPETDSTASFSPGEEAAPRLEPAASGRALICPSQVESWRPQVAEPSAMEVWVS
jgi:hypothetical protein